MLINLLKWNLNLFNWITTSTLHFIIKFVDSREVNVCVMIDINNNFTNFFKSVLHLFNI